MMGWAILASPHSQYAMAMSCGIDDEIKIDELQGYHFLDHKELKIPHQTLCKYLRAIEDHYVTTNPYHNEVHAADILQTTHTMLQMIQQQKQYQHASNARPIFHVTTIEQFALLLTAVVHDVEHTGKNNAFEVNTQSEVALVYNDMKHERVRKYYGEVSYDVDIHFFWPHAHSRRRSSPISSSSCSSCKSMCSCIF